MSENASVTLEPSRFDSANPLKPVRSPELHAMLCQEIEGGKSLREICEQKGWPCRSFFVQWHREDSEVAHRYAGACEARADFLGDELVSLADSALNPTLVDEDGTTRIDPAMVAAIRLAVDTRKWVASKLHRSKYGDQPATQTVNVGVSVVPQIEIHVPAALANRRSEE